MNKMIKIGICIAYDWRYLEYSLPLLYNEADRICLSLDKDRISWSGKHFDFDEEGFKSLILSIDVHNKIDVYEDDFHLSTLAPIENDTRQRQLMSKRLGEGGWHLQIDSDEYFINFPKFVSWIKKINVKRSVNIRCPYITLFKKVENGYLVIEGKDYFELDGAPIATNSPNYKYARVNGWFNIHAPFFVIHQSWARSDSEIDQKIQSWGHKNDFDLDKYILFWRNLSKYNYQNVENFHPIVPNSWFKLRLVPGDNILDIIRFYHDNIPVFPNKMKFFFKNSVVFSKIKSFFGKKIIKKR